MGGDQRAKTGGTPGTDASRRESGREIQGELHRPSRSPAILATPGAVGLRISAASFPLRRQGTPPRSATLVCVAPTRYSVLAAQPIPGQGGEARRAKWDKRREGESSVFRRVKSKKQRVCSLGAPKGPVGERGSLAPSMCPLCLSALRPYPWDRRLPPSHPPDGQRHLSRRVLRAELLV